jgi:hypothetical protein
VEDVTKAIEDLDAARTFSGSNPDGPVRRGEDGFYLDGSHPPTVSGSPTERLLWIVLYHQMKFHNYISVAELTVQLGACQAAMLAAVRSLEARGVAQSCTDSPGCPGHHVRLCRAYTRQAANDRAAWQVEYEAKCERDAWVKDHLEVDPDSSPNITEGSYAAARKMVVDAALAASSATTTEVAE